MSVRGTKRATGVRGEEAGTSKRRRTEPEDALWQLRPDVKMPSIYNRSASEAPAELFRKDLISAMKLPDSEPLTASEYWVITDTWKQDWERGVQVPVNPDSLPAPKVKIIDNPLPPDFQEFKLPKDKYIHLTRDAHFQPDKHHLSATPARAEAACSYDLDALDTAWLKLLNAERARAGAMPINENQLEKVLEELEVLTALFFFASGSYQRPVGVASNTSQKMCSVYIEQVTEALICKNMINKYIRFPDSTAMRQTISQRFYAKYGIPGVIGCIDGTHIKIFGPPKEEEHWYYCRKHYHSLNVQMVRTWDKIQAIMKSEEGLGIEYDENVICDVCRSPDSEDGNEMVFCDACNICVHQACYGITVIPDGQWLCRPCGDGVRPTCVLCPNLGGAMKCTPSGHKWAHVSCVLWIPEVSIGCAERMEPITKISAIPASRWSLLCVLCRERKGACIQCSVKTCKTAYHVTCAFKHGLEMRAIIEDENADDGVKLRSYCQKHSVNNKKDKSSGSGSEEEEVKRKRRKDMTSEEKTQARAARLQEIEYEFDRHVSIKDISTHLLDVDQDAIVYIYNYWKLKRRAGHNRPLLPPKSDDSELLTHRQEQADLDKMKMFVQLRQDLERVRNLCYMVSRREKLSRSFFRLREQTFHKQVAVLTADPSISGPELAAIIEANHGPSIYDRLYSHDNAPDHQNDFDALMARIAPPDSSDEKKKDRNGLVKGSKSANPYKRHYVNGSRRSGSMYSGLSSEESAPEISRSNRHRGRAIGSSTDDDAKKPSSPKKKVSPKTKGKRSPKKTERKKKKIPQSKAILESSSEDESLKAKMKKDRTRSKTLTQMEKEMTAGKIDQSGTDSDELMPMRTTRNNKFPVDIYSDSSEEDVKPEVSDKTKSSDKLKAEKSPSGNDSQQPLPRTKAAMKEFILHPEKKAAPEEEKPAPKKRGRKPSNKDKKPPPPVKVESEDEAKNKENIKALKQKDNPTDLIVPQRQAAKKASENMRSTTAVKKDEPEKPVSGDDTKNKPKVKSKGKEVKDTKDVTPSTSPAKVGRKKSSKEAEKEPISYVPQRQAAKKAAAHIKSGLGSKLPVVENDTDKKKDDKSEFLSPKKEEIKSKPLPKDSSSSSTSSSSSCSSSSSSDEEPEKPGMKPTAKAPEIKPARQPSMFSPPGSRPTVDLPFLDKVSRPLSSTSASSDGDSSQESRSGSGSPALKLPRRRRKGSRLSSDTSPRKAPDKKLKTSERRSECGVPSPVAEGEEPRGADARAATRARTRSTTSSGNLPNKPDARQRKPTKDDAGPASGSNKTTPKESFQPGQLSSPKREEDEEIKKEIKNEITINDVKPKVGRPKSRSISMEDKDKIKSPITDTTPLVKVSPRKSIDTKQKSRRMSVKDTSPIRRLSVKDTSPSRRTTVKDSSPSSRVSVKDTLPSRRMSVKDTSPNRRINIKDSPPKRRMSIKESSPSRRLPGKDSSPNRRMTIKDPSPSSRLHGKESLPSRRMSIKDPSPRRRMSVKDSSPKRRMSVKDTSPKHMDSLISEPTDTNVASVKERRFSRAELLSATCSLSPVKKLISERPSEDLNLNERKSPLAINDFTDHDKHWLTAPSPLCPPPVIERPGLNDKYIGEDKSMDSDSADKSSVNMMAKIQANLNENTMIKSPKTPMDARISMDPLEMESTLVRSIRKRVSIDPEKKFITQDASHVQGVEISKSAKIPSVANPFPNRSMFSPQSKDNELFDYDMMAVDDGFNHDDMTKPFSSYPEFIFKEDSKEQGVQETLNLVDRLRMQLSSKKIPIENPVQEESMNVDKEQKDDENNMTSNAGEGEHMRETLPSNKSTAYDLHNKHIPKDSHSIVNHVAPPYNTDATSREPSTDKNYQEPIPMTSKDKWADIPLPDDPPPNDRKYDNHSNSYHEEVKEASTIQSDVQSVSEIGDTISISKQSDDSQSLSVADHSVNSNDHELTQDNQTYDNNNSLAHSDCATISSPYIGQDPKYRGESKITTRRSSASSTTSEGSTCSQKPVMKSHLNSIDSHQSHVIPDIDLYPLPAYSCSVVEPAMPLNQYSAFAPDASPFISSSLPLFTPGTGQLPLPSPGPGLFPPGLPFPTTSLSSLHSMQPKPAFPQLCATFTTSSQNIALTTAMIAPPTPKPIDSPRDDIDVTGSDKFSIHVASSPSISVDSYDASNNRSTKMSNDSNETMSSMHPQESKSPPKLPLAKTTPKFTGKSPGKSPAGISPKQSEPAKGTKRASNRSNRSQRGRGRSKSRAQGLQGFPVDYMGNSIQNKLVGTVYDFDEEIANDGVDLKALRDRRKSIDVRDDRKSEHSFKDASQSPVASPQINKRPPPSVESKDVKPPSPEVRERSASPADGAKGPGFAAVAPVLPGPVDMRTYQPFENPAPAAGDAYLLEFASGTAEQQLPEIDEEFEKQLHSALMASKPRPGSPTAPPAPKPTEPPKETFTPQLPKVSLSDSRNQLKVKIKGPFLDANYSASSVTPVVPTPPVPVHDPISSFNAPGGTPSSMMTGSGLRRMRKKELLRQYWTQDMNQDDPTAASTMGMTLPPAQPPPLARTVTITIPKAVASMTSIPTREDYKMCDTPIEKKKRKTTSGLSRELRHLTVSMNDDVDPTDETKLPSYTASQAYKRRGRVTVKPNANPAPAPVAPKLKIKLSSNSVQQVNEESSGFHQFRPPKKRLMNLPKPSMEDVRRENMKFRRKIMADFEENEKTEKHKPPKSDKRKKKKDKKAEKLQVINSESESATKLIIKIKRTKEEEGGEGALAAAAAAPEPPVVADPFEYDPSAPDPLALDPPSYSDSAAMRKVRTDKVTPIRLKLSRSSKGSGYVMKESEEQSGSEPPSASHSSPLPLAVNKHCEVR